MFRQPRSGLLRSMGQAPGASSWIATPNNRRFRRFANEAVLFTTTFYARRTRFPSGLTPPSLPRVAPQGAALSTAEKTKSAYASRANGFL